MTINMNDLHDPEHEGDFPTSEDPQDLDIESEAPHDIDRVMREFHAENKRRGWYTIGGAVVLAVLLVTVLTLLNPPQPNTGKMGIHLMLDDGQTSFDPVVWEPHFEYASQVGRYVTQIIRLEDLDTAKWQRFFDLCAEYELTPIIRLATSYDAENAWWTAPPVDENGGYTSAAQQYADFFADISFEGDVYVLVGSTPNRGDSWGGAPDPAAYTRFLTAVSQAVRAARGQTWIGNGALDHFAPHTNGQPRSSNGMVDLDGESFIDAMFAADANITRVLDVWNTHVYSLTPPWSPQHHIEYLNGASNPDALTPVEGLYNLGVNNYNWELYKLTTLENRKIMPVIISETGWSRLLFSEEDIVQFTDLAYFGNNGHYPDQPEEGWVPWIEDSRVLAVTPFVLAGSPVRWDEYNWLEVASDGTITGTRDVFEVIAGRFSGN